MKLATALRLGAVCAAADLLRLVVNLLDRVEQAEQCGSSDQRSDEATKRAKGKTAITSSRPRTFSGIDDRSIIAKDGAGRQVCLIDVRRPEDVHHRSPAARR